MENPILSQINGSRTETPRTNNMALDLVYRQNPALAQFIQTNGGDPKSAFYALAKQKGIDPDAFLSALRSRF